MNTLIAPSSVVLPSEEEVNAYLLTRRHYLLAKRLFDVALSLILLVALSPVFALTAILVRLDSEGPVLFAQARWGVNGRRFTCYKFRSMYLDSDSSVAAGSLDERLQGGHLVKIENDPRVTRVGRVLRKTSIDELPQLWNVLRGDMSLVGPRPLMIHMLAPYPEIHVLRGKVRPGITGLWQVSDRSNNTHVSSMLAYDLAYLQDLSVGLDAKILLRTTYVVLSGAGAM